uniref:Uncharacterized protein n=1 Tax=Nelumbo nucifera TaxID=4432 RepID=A0A822XQ12_NELNU|nr:TPA_asm: hypothetical protein HUJ06_023226 [Nelumbo nucifera]
MPRDIFKILEEKNRGRQRKNSKNRETGKHHGDLATNDIGRGDENLRNDAYTAAAYGDLEKLHRLRDWAALNNRTAAAQYVIEVWMHSWRDVNWTDDAAFECYNIRDAIQVAELLLRLGDAADYDHQVSKIGKQSKSFLKVHI